AGKSTLIKIITGAVDPDAGELKLKGEPVLENSPALAKARGIAAIYQQPALFGELTVVENITMGLDERSPSAATRDLVEKNSSVPLSFKSASARFERHFRPIDWKARRRLASELLERVEADIDPDIEASRLSMPQQQLVEIARALGANAQVLILDEPTASLSEKDARHLFGVIRQLRSEGAGVIYISHRLDELPANADRVTGPRDGCTIATRSMAETDREQLIHLMVGRELSAVFPKRQVEIGAPVLDVRDLGCSENGTHDVSFTVRAGEIFGLAGLVG